MWAIDIYDCFRRMDIIIYLVEIQAPSGFIFRKAEWGMLGNWNLDTIMRIIRWHINQ